MRRSRVTKLTRPATAGRAASLNVAQGLQLPLVFKEQPLLRPQQVQLVGLGGRPGSASHHFTSLHITPIHATPRHATPHHATPRHATPRRAMTHQPHTHRQTQGQCTWWWWWGRAAAAALVAGALTALAAADGARSARGCRCRATLNTPAIFPADNMPCAGRRAVLGSLRVRGTVVQSETKTASDRPL